MARVQVQGIEAPQLQSQSAGRVQLNTAIPETSASKLLGALAKGSSGIAKSFAQIKDAKAEEDNSAADSYYNSRTLEEIQQEIKEGTLPADASPVFRARIEHNYGSNYMAQITRDAEEKLANGEFSVEGRDPQESFDKYLTDARNTFLEGASKYTVAGFDKNYNATKLKFEDMIAKQNTAERQMEAQGSVTESGINTLNTFIKPDEYGVKKVAKGGVTALVTTVQAELAQTHANPANRKGVFANLATELAASGDVNALKEYLDTDLGNGLTIEKVISGRNPEIGRKFRSDALTAQGALYRKEGETHHDRFRQQAERGELDEKEFNRLRNTFEPYMDWGDIVTMNNTRRASMARDNERAQATFDFTNNTNRFNDAAGGAVNEALANGVFNNIGDVTVTSPTGTPKVLKGQDATVAQIIAKTEGNPEQRAYLFAGFGYEDAQTKLELTQLASGLTTAVNKDGVMSESIVRNHETFRIYNKTNPAYTRQLMGEAAYARVKEFDMLVTMGNSREQAANTQLLLAKANSVEGSVSSKKLMTRVDTAMAAITNRPWYDKLATFVGGSPSEKDILLGGDVEAGTGEISGMLTRMAKGLMLSGQVDDPDAAIDSAFNTMVSSGAVVKANNRLYKREDLPSRLPEGMNPPEAMEVYRNALVSTFARYKQEYEPENIILSANGNGTFSVKIRGSNNAIFIPRVKDKPITVTLKMMEDYLGEREKRGDQRKISEYRATNSSVANGILQRQSETASAKLLRERKEALR